MMALFIYRWTLLIMISIVSVHSVEHQSVYLQAQNIYRNIHKVYSGSKFSSKQVLLNIFVAFFQFSNEISRSKLWINCLTFMFVLFCTSMFDHLSHQEPDVVSISGRQDSIVYIQAIYRAKI